MEAAEKNVAAELEEQAVAPDETVKVNPDRDIKVEIDYDKKGSKRVVWTEKMDRTLFGVLADAMKGNLRGNNGFKADVYHKAAEEVSKTAKFTVAVSNVRTRLDILKRHWSVACSLMGRSGWSYSLKEQRIDADFDVWEAEVKANPKSAWIRGKQLYWFEMANDIWAGQVATGSHAFSSVDPSPSNGGGTTPGAKSSPATTPPGETSLFVAHKTFRYNKV